MAKWRVHDVSKEDSPVGQDRASRARRLEGFFSTLFVIILGFDVTFNRIS